MENPYTAPAMDVRLADVTSASPYSVTQMRAAFAWFAWAYWVHIGSFVLLVAVVIALASQVVMQGIANPEAQMSEAEMQAAVQALVASKTILLGSLVVVILGTALVLLVFTLVLLYRYWAVMQPFTTRTTPGKAVGFLFIPGFNLYWMFVAYHGLAKEIDRYVTSHPAAKVPSPASGLVMAMLVLFPVTLLAFVRDAPALVLLGNLASLILIVILFVCKLRLNNSIIGIIQDRARQQAFTAPTAPTK